ncbi:DJ-1/PfpI family protein [Calothrix sp. FACHB-156]|uniref:type 1 glutamine amidotransferase domain-containing protein n=1 Tax=unclassified Tolypothrix TaxID=2649714 RepID=UPI0005EAC45C|nr:MULTISPECIES: type 1 glutamine amidotransferase domain-containing protein [unclassified Tolypothrix]MBD2211694.1 DJ-1/PfpI family protein [Nostoc linckia FACHB-104]MBD2338758.1 DJ-1/PfpI family protein [Calothrix sp. FACHB-156]BAY94483.1 ThiJ/PfpI domain protein [Microchaete diplosiphon NIES-3275]EKE97063.1 DJ-1/PfpI family protein [Tolypothrix sp. PCC 7601]MBE9086156.1 DJ-1/PfpI family protein [Tolypothrix sp. LEGE 11397]
MTKNVLFIISEWGYWGEELIGPLEACDAAGYNITFVTPNGKKPTPLSVSCAPGYIDPPLGRGVTSEEMGAKTVRVHESDRLDSPKSLADWFPLRAYPSSPTYLRDMEAYYQKIDKIIAEELVNYDALVIVGGSGALIDLANNSRLHELILGFVKLNKPIAAECYGVTCLAFARDFREKKSLIWGKHVTGHPIDYDYLDGTGFEGPHAIDGSKKGFGDGYINFGPPFYPLEFILRDAVGPDGAFIGNVGHQTSVLVDYPFITSRSTASSVECGRILVEVLEKGLTRYGW